MSSGARPDRGSVSAELVVALPAVVLVLLVCAWGVGLAGAQVRLEDAAGSAARAAARGEGDVAGLLAAVPGATSTSQRDGDLLCLTVRLRRTGPFGLAPVWLSARSCALDGT